MTSVRDFEEKLSYRPCQAAPPNAPLAYHLHGRVFFRLGRWKEHFIQQRSPT